MSAGHTVDYEKLYRQIVDQLSLGVLIVDEVDTIIFINLSAQSMLAMSDRQACGLTLGQCFRQSDQLFDVIKFVRRNRVACTQREVRLSFNNEHYLTADLSINMLSDDGEMILEINPVDRRLKIDRERRQFADDETVRLLVQGLAHEIKNPLGGLRGAAQLLARELPTSDLREYTDVIIDEADRLRRLVDGLMGPTTRHDPKRTNIHWILERVRQLIEVEAAEGIRIDRDYDPSIPDMSAEPDHLIQAFLNIARNAMQALGDSGTIRLRTRTENHFTIANHMHRVVLRVDIEDDGPGVKAEMIDRVFFPMITTKPTGTGVGLAISRSLVHQQGGLIECHSVEGLTRFTIWLPLEPADD